MFVLYNLVLLVLSPLIALYILYRILISGKSRNSWRQQLGNVQLPEEVSKNHPIWVHAVSVGESVACSSVVSELKQTKPETKVVVSTTTETGQAMARKSVTDADGFIYFPFDLASFVSCSISGVKPSVFASTDTEIWPNFLHIAHKRGVKTAIINGTVSDRTLRGAKRVPWLYRWALSNVDRFCVQSATDAERIIAMGAEPKRVTVTGNCKADQAYNPISGVERNEIRFRFGLTSDDRVFIAGSTNPGEDEPVIDAFIAAKREHKSLRLIIAPRQIERRQEICDLARGKGLICSWRSEPDTISGSEDVIILDTFGELASVYAIADVSFVGGSLIPKGCHSILQPIAQGKPVFFGPYTFKARDLVAQAKRAGVGFEVKSGEELGARISEMLYDRPLLNDIAKRCEQMMFANLGASKRTADILAELHDEWINEQGGSVERRDEVS